MSITNGFTIGKVLHGSNKLKHPKLPRTEGERAKPKTQNYLFSPNLRGKMPRRVGENK